MEPTAKKVRSVRNVSWQCPCAQTLSLTARIVRYADGSSRWSLHRYSRGLDPIGPPISPKACPDCGLDLSQVSVDELTSAVWPTGIT